jgi:hydroxymethylpyrimidine/phosphomethylpyrimidine kinase
MRIVLTIAGSDSGGGAGIQADLKTFHQFGVFGTSVITAVTAQNTLGVTDWEAVSVRLVQAQLDVVIADLPPAALKSGMLGEREVVVAVAERIRTHQLGNYVLDPVMVATSGDLLLRPDAVSALRDDLVPLATVVTPNLDEARLLLETDVKSRDDMERAAEQLVTGLGAKAALVKGGHLGGARVFDVLFDGTRHTCFENARISTNNTHGTGCTLSAAIAAGLAKGRTLEGAARAAIDFVHRAMQSAPGLGAGHGPLDHFVAATEASK